MNMQLRQDRLDQLLLPEIAGQKLALACPIHRVELECLELQTRRQFSSSAGQQQASFRVLARYASNLGQALVIEQVRAFIQSIKTESQFACLDSWC